MKKKSKSCGANPSNLANLGIPKVLEAIQDESIITVLPIKLQPTLAEYLRRKGGSTYVREIIMEKLRGLHVEPLPRPAVCKKCACLDKSEESPFCSFLGAFIDRTLLNNIWECEGFQPREGTMKP